MKLPTIPFLNKKKDSSEYYLALLLDDEKAESVILQEILGKVKIVSQHLEHLSLPLETIPLDDLIKVIDRTISRAEEVLPPNIETHKTVFGVKESWIDEESKKIKKEHLSKLKKVCDSLELSPIGFMVVSEAIANLLQNEEGAPLSALLADFGKKSVHLTLFRGGKISESLSGPIHESASVTVDTMLKNFTAPVLPTRIIIFHGKDSDSLAQQFMRHEWSKSLPFLHVPQITVLPAAFDAKAVTFGAAHQMGFEVLGMESKPANIEQHEVNEAQDELIEDKESEENKEIGEPEILEPAKLDDNATDSRNDFGFVMDEDVATKSVENAPVAELANTSEPIVVAKEPDYDNLQKVHIPDTRIEAHEENAKEPKSVHKKNLMAGIFAMIPSIKMPKSFKLPRLFIKSKGFTLPLIIAGVILVLGIGISWFYFYNTSAEVVVSVKPKEVSQDENVTFSTSSPSDFSKNIIAGKSISTGIDGELSTPATGKKDKGEKAKGQVTIYNSSDSSKSLSSGLAIRSTNGVLFTIDKDVTIASASGDIFTGTKPGTAQVGVTAKEIGTDSNLPSNSKFQVSGNPGLAAKNDTAFSGGSKKTVTVVSKEDLAKLKSDLPKSLEQKANEELSKKVQGGETVLSGFVNETLEKTKFDKAADDEAKEVKLSATVNFESISYQNADLENFDKSILKDHFSQDISFSENSLKNEIKSAKVKSDKEILTTLTIKAGLLPKINKDEVINKLKNKSPKEAKEILKSLPQVTSTEINFSPNIFSFLSGIFQKLPKNISVKVQPE